MKWHRPNHSQASSSFKASIQLFFLNVHVFTSWLMHPNQNWACLVRYLKIISTVLKNNKHIVWETQNWYQNFSKPSGLKLLHQNRYWPKRKKYYFELKKPLAYSNLNTRFEFVRQLFVSGCILLFKTALLILR